MSLRENTGSATFIVRLDYANLPANWKTDEKVHVIGQSEPSHDGITLTVTKGFDGKLDLRVDDGEDGVSWGGALPEIDAGGLTAGVSWNLGKITFYLEGREVGNLCLRPRSSAFRPQSR
jgi:hypothetical protein